MSDTHAPTPTTDKTERDDEIKKTVETIKAGKEGLKFFKETLPYLADGVVLALSLLGLRDRAREVRAAKEAITSGAVSHLSGLDIVQLKEMIEHLQKGDKDKAREAGIKAGIFGIGHEDEGEMIWVTTEFYGYFQDLTPPDFKTPATFTKFMGKRSRTELRDFRLALGRIPLRKDQTKAVIRLAKQIANAHTSKLRMETLQDFFQMNGVAHEPSAIGQAAARGIAASTAKTETYVNDKRARIRRDTETALRRP